MTNLPPPLDLLPTLLPALIQTIQITLGASLLATVAAFGAGFGMVSRDPVLRAASRTFVEIFRGSSALILLFWAYYALPLAGVNLTAMQAAIIVLGLHIGAYGAEVVRGAVQAVPTGQREAARALNYSDWQTTRFVVFPLALRAMLPPFGNLLIELLKATALVSLITINELTRTALFLRDETLRSAEIFGLVLVLYFLLASVIAWGMKRLEAYVGRGIPIGSAR